MNMPLHYMRLRAIVVILAASAVAATACDTTERATTTPRTAETVDATVTVESPSPSPAPRAQIDPAEVGANELGAIPVIMYHRVQRGSTSAFDRSPKAFMAELKRLYREGYRPIRAVDLVRGKIDVPPGTTPVVLTFDDSSPSQFGYTRSGRIKRDTAVGMLIAFAKGRPDFDPVATLFVNDRPFGLSEPTEALRDLDRRGFEIGNHTLSHANLGPLSRAQVHRELALGARLITKALPGARVATLSLPLGIRPAPARLARRGRWRRFSYRHAGIFLVGAGPAPSPFARGFDPAAIPRIRSSSFRGGEPNFGSSYWLDYLDAHPAQRYVSDGDPDRVSFPHRLRDRLARGHRSAGDPYRR